MMKRSQVSFYILLGFLLIFMSLFLLFNANRNLNQEMPNEPQDYRNFLHQCIKGHLMDSFDELGLTAGWFTKYNPVYLKQQPVNTIVEKDSFYLNPFENISKELEKRALESTRICIRELDSKAPEKIKSRGEASCEISFAKSTVFRIKPGISVMLKDSIKRIDNLMITVPVRLRETYNQLEDIIREIYKTDSLVPLTDLHNMQGMNSTVIVLNGSVQVFVIDDYYSKIGNEPFRIIFVRDTG